MKTAVIMESEQAENQGFHAYKLILSTASIALGIQLAVWLSGFGGTDAHLIVAPFWLLPVLWVFLRGENRNTFSDYTRFLNIQINRLKPRMFFALLLLFFGVGWSLSFTAKFYSFDYASYDVGIYSSIAYNSAIGHFFFSSVQDMNHLGEHFSPIMLAFSPFYRLYAEPVWLFGALLVAYLSVPILIYWICGKLNVFPPGNEAPVYLLCVLWLLYRPMASAVSFAFHPSSLTAPLILIAYYFQAQKRWGLFYVALFMLLLFKENLTLVWVGFGLFLMCEPGERKRGAFLALSGGLFALFLINYFIPHFRGGAWKEHMDRLAPLEDIGSKAYYLFRLFTPLLYIPMMRLKFFLLVMPAIALNLVTGFEPQYSTSFHYDDITAALIFVAVIEFFRKGGKKDWQNHFSSKRWVTILPVFCLLFILVDLPASPYRVARKNWPTEENIKILQEIKTVKKELLKPETMLFGQSHLDVHFQRYKKADLKHCNFADPPENALIVLSRNVNPWPYNDISGVVKVVESSGKFTQSTNYYYLTVYRAKEDTSEHQGGQPDAQTLD